MTRTSKKFSIHWLIITNKTSAPPPPPNTKKAKVHPTPQAKTQQK